MDYEMKNWKFDDGKKTGTGSIHLDNKQQVVDNYVHAYNDDQENNAEFRESIVKYRSQVKEAKADLKNDVDMEWRHDAEEVRESYRKTIQDISSPPSQGAHALVASPAEQAKKAQVKADLK